MRHSEAPAPAIRFLTGWEHGGWSAVSIPEQAQWNAKANRVKIAAIWTGALILGFLGGTLGQWLTGGRTVFINQALSTKAHIFELVDRSGRVVSVWTTDQWGRPFLGFSDATWEGRIVIGPIEHSDVISNKPPDVNAAWGISVTAPRYAAHVAFGTGTDERTGKPIGFASCR